MGSSHVSRKMLALCGVCTAAAQASSAWVPQGSLHSPHDRCAATLLPDGRVQVSGGFDLAYHGLTGVDVYDPNTGRWTAVSDTTYGHADHGLVMLPTGKVLLVDSAPDELYDMATGMWSLAPNPPEPADTLGLILLGGSAFVAGGGATVKTAATNIFDAATEQWTTSGPLNTARVLSAMTLLPSGKVLITGGFTDDANPSTSSTNLTELYDPSSHVWTPAAPMQTARSGHHMVLLYTGRVLATGGGLAMGTTPTSELYDPSAGTWSSAADGGVLGGSALAMLPSGAVLTCGSSSAPFAKACAAYDATNDTWSPVPDLNVQRTRGVAVLLPSGRVLLTAGVHASAPATSEIYDPRSPLWSSAAPLPAVSGPVAALLLPSGDVLASGSGATGAAAAWRFRAPTLDWVGAAAPAQDRTGHRLTLLVNGGVLVTGGQSHGGVNLASAERFDPALDAWSAAAPMSIARRGHTAVALPGGQVLVAGGASDTSAELYDPAADHWSLTGPMVAARSGHTSTLLPDGRVLIAGGGTAACELYDPSSQRFTPAKPMAASRAGHTATLLPNGKVLVAGGGTASCELYDSSSDTWASAAPMSVARTSHTATLLWNDEVLVVGVTPDPQLNAEVYDPASDVWWTASTAGTARVGHAAVRMHDGRVLLVGGLDSGGAALSSAMLFDEGRHAWPGAAPILSRVDGGPASITFSGTQLTGLTAGGGDVESSPSNIPILFVEREEGGWQVPASSRGWTAVSGTALLGEGLFPGWYRVRVVTNGISSPELSYQYGAPGQTCATNSDCAASACTANLCCDVPCPDGHCAGGHCDLQMNPLGPPGKPSAWVVRCGCGAATDGVAAAAVLAMLSVLRAARRRRG